MSGDYTHKSAKNMIVSLGVQIVVLLLGFFSRYIFIHVLSAEYLGINGLFTNVLTLLSFTELGIGEALVFAMYKPMKEGNESKLKALLYFYKKAYTWIAIAVLAIGFIISFFVDGFVNEKPNISENFQVIFVLFLLNNVTSYIMVYKQSLLMVDQSKYLVSLVQQAVKIGQMCFQILLLYFTHSYYAYLILQIVGTLMTNFVLSVYVNKHYPFASQKGICRLDKEEKSAIFQDIKALSISKIAGIVSNGADNIVIARLINLTSVGLVSNYTMVTGTVNGLIWNTLSSITGSIGQFNVDSSIERKRTVFDELFLLTFWIYSFVTIGLVTMLSPLVTIWLGSDYVIETSVVVALVSIIYVNGLNFPFYSFRVTCGLFEPLKYNYVIFALSNIAVSIVLGIKFGLTGIYAATVITRLLTTEFKEGIVVYTRILNKRKALYFLKYFGFAALHIATFAVTKTVVELIPMDGWAGWIVKCIACSIFVNLLYAFAFFRTKAFRGLVQKGRKLVKRSPRAC